MKYQKTILIIGFGSIGRRHVNNLLRLTDVRLIIFSKRKNIKSNEFFDYRINKNRIEIISDFDKCLDKEPSIAFITNETSFHISFALRLAKKGIDLFIEKPLSHSIKNLTYLQRLVNKNKLIVMIGCNFRFYPPICKIKELVDKKSIGKIISVQSENGSYLPHWHPKEDYSKNYAARKDLGGGVILTQIHELDYITWIFGSIEKLYSFSGKFSHLKVTADDLCASIIQLRNNIIVELHLDYFSNPYFKRLKIRGTKGIIYWNSIENKIKIFNNKNNTLNVVKIKDNYNLSGRNVNRMYADELLYFLQCVLSRKQPMNNIDQSIVTLKNALNLKNFG